MKRTMTLTGAKTIVWRKTKVNTIHFKRFDSWFILLWLL